MDTLSSTCRTLPGLCPRRPDGKSAIRRGSRAPPGEPAARRTWPTRFSAMQLYAKLDKTIRRTEPEPARMHTQPDQPRRGGGRRIGGAWPEPPHPQPDLDGRADALRQYLGSVRRRPQGAASWLSTPGHYARLLNRDVVVPVTSQLPARGPGVPGYAPR